MADELNIFIKEIILDEKVPKNIRKEALDVLLKSVIKSLVRVTGEVYITRFEYLNTVALLRQEKRIQAIKAIRDITGLGLKEAKDYIDNLQKKVKRGED